MMTRQQFDQLAREGHNRIPLWRSIAADLDTPLSVYLKLVDGPNAFLLESVQGGENWGRYSIIGLPCQRSFRGQGRQLTEWQGETLLRRFDDVDPMQVLAELIRQQSAPQLPELPGFSGGLVGYFAYETIGLIEPSLATQQTSSQPDARPDILFLDATELAVFDNLAGRLNLIVNVDPNEEQAFEKGQQRLDHLVQSLRATAPPYPPSLNLTPPAADAFIFEFEREAFQAAVARVQDYILAGDAMQVVLSQRMRIQLDARPLDVYRALRSLNPSPYMYFFDFGAFHVVGASPEVLVRVQGGQAMVRPIAGTRPRGKDPAEDQALEAELRADPKELAEHLMLIDLGRNDIGRIAETGSVTLTEQMVVERYSHVMHLVSEVHGQLKPGLSAMDALRATFPAGTVSGAPKVRAMQIIAELEPSPRGLYAGAVGYFDWQGQADLAIAIRTALVQDGVLHIQAGAGIVADSDPEREWQETLSKARALVSAVIEASGGLHQ